MLAPSERRWLCAIVIVGLILCEKTLPTYPTDKGEVNDVWYYEKNP